MNNNMKAMTKSFSSLSFSHTAQAISQWWKHNLHEWNKALAVTHQDEGGLQN